MPRTILLADDSSTIRKIVELTFHDTDIRVEMVGTGAEAVARLDALRPDLVLADVVMPEPTGYEICRRIKNSEHPVPVVLLAGTFEPFDLELARDCGADDHLVKPFESQTLVDKVENLLNAPSGSPLEVERAMDDLIDGDEPADTETAEPTETPEDAMAEGVPMRLSPAEIDQVARVVIERLSDRVVREIAAEVVPELARKILREHE